MLNHQLLNEQKFDILWNNASLMHLSKRELNQFLGDAHSLCTGDAIFGSLFYAGKESLERFTDLTFVPDRYLSQYAKHELAAMHEKNGWRVLLMSPAADYQRKGEWFQILATQKSSQILEQ